MPPLGNERCPEGGPELQVTRAGARARAGSAHRPLPGAATLGLRGASGAAGARGGGVGARPAPARVGALTLPACRAATFWRLFPGAAGGSGGPERGPRGGGAGCFGRWRSFCRSRLTLWPSSWARQRGQRGRGRGPPSLRPRPSPASSPGTTSATRSSPTSKPRTCSTSGTRRSRPRWPRPSSWAGSTSRSC